MLRSKSSNHPMGTFTHLYPQSSMDFLTDLTNNSISPCCKKLQDLSLLCILKNFKIVMEEYYKYKQANILNVNFEFLKRNWSKLFFELLSFQDNLESDYLPFLINNFTKELNLVFYSSALFCTNKLDEILKDIGNGIIKLNVSGGSCKYTKIIELFSLLPNLEIVFLDFTPLKNSVLSNMMEKCPKVKHVSLSHNKWVYDRSLHFLCFLNENDELVKNTHLEVLNVEGTDVTIHGIQFAFKYFPSLISLIHRKVANALYELHYDDLINNRLEECTKYGLQGICIYSDCDILKVLQICIKLCPNIFNLEVNKITLQEEIDSIMEFQTLKIVNFVFDQHRNLTLSDQFFTKHKFNLKELSITGASFSLKLLCECRNLEILRLIDPQFEMKDELLPSDYFPELRKLEFKKFSLEQHVLDCVLLILMSCPNLKHLVFEEVPVPTAAIASAIAKCPCIPNVVTLDMGFSEISFEALDVILSSTKLLRCLIIENCGISTKNYDVLTEKYKIKIIGP